MALRYQYSRIIYDDNNNQLIEHIYEISVISKNDQPVNEAIKRTLLELSKEEVLDDYQ